MAVLRWAKLLSGVASLALLAALAGCGGSAKKQSTEQAFARGEQKVRDTEVRYAADALNNDEQALNALRRVVEYTNKYRCVAFYSNASPDESVVVYMAITSAGPWVQIPVKVTTAVADAVAGRPARRSAVHFDGAKFGESLAEAGMTPADFDAHPLHRWPCLLTAAGQLTVTAPHAVQAATPTTTSSPISTASGTDEQVILGDHAVGSWDFKPAGGDANQAGRLSTAVAAFGEPPSLAVIDNLCVASWPDLGLSVKFFYSGDPCEASPGTVVEIDLKGQWKTDKGLKVGDPVADIQRAYPNARVRKDGSWALVTVNAAELGSLATLAAVVDGDTISGFRLQPS